jgi:hypothetical protein
MNSIQLFILGDYHEVEQALSDLVCIDCAVTEKKMGYTDDQFIRNEVTVKLTIETGQGEAIIYFPASFAKVKTWFKTTQPTNINHIPGLQNDFVEQHKAVQIAQQIINEGLR